MSVFEELNGVDSECRSYLVADSGEAMIVDPVLKRAGEYLRRLADLRLRLAYAVDTHTHADHLSASKELARRTGAQIAGAPRCAVQVPLGEGSVYVVTQEQTPGMPDPVFEGQVATLGRELRLLRSLLEVGSCGT